MDESDEQLVGWSLAGDPAAFVELFWRHGPAVHAYLARRVGRQDADDLLGEVWLRAFKGRTSRRGPDALPWLYGIAHNVLRAHWRHDAWPSILMEPLGVFDPWPDTDSRLDAAVQGESLRRVLATLSEGERNVLLLVIWEQLTPTEAAMALGITQGAARTRLHRALSTLRGQGVTSSPAPICSQSEEA